MEIGPGAGRWTEYLAKRAARLILVDLTPLCIEMCKKRFESMSHLEYFVNNGNDLSFIDERSIDRIWSWDVFVHIMSEDIRHYVLQFARLLKPGGMAVIHHSRHGIDQRGWRSDMTAAKMGEFCDEAGLVLTKQFDSWDQGRVQIWPDLPAGKGPDIISILQRPPT